LAGNVATYLVENDVKVSIEVDTIEGFTPAGLDEIVGKVRDAIAPAVLAAREVLERVKALSPAEVEVKFGVKATGTMNWVVAKAASEGNFEVTLAWRPAPDGSRADPVDSG